MSTVSDSPVQPRSARLPRHVLVTAWLAPVMVATGFALLSLIPVLVALAGTLRHQRLRPLRWWSAAAVAGYLPALAMWAIGPDRAESLTKEMSLPMTLFVIAVAAAAAVRLTVFWIRHAKTTGE